VSSQALAHPLPRSTGKVAVLSALAGAIAILAVIGAVHLATGSHPGATPDRTFTASGRAFSIAVPEGWTALRGAALARTSGSPAAVLRRPDGRGVVIVRRTGALTGDLRTVARSLTAQLESRLPGFHLVSARLGRVRAGGAFLYTFVRGRTAQSLAVTRIRGVTYRIDSIVPAGTPEVARQAGTIVGSFGP
jgi:hypothetical protein